VQFDEIFKQMVQAEASDLFLKVGAPPAMRTAGRVVQMNTEPVSLEQMNAFLEEVCDDRQRNSFYEGNEVDTSYEVFGLGRFRVNVYRQRGYAGMVFRHIKNVIPTMEELNLPGETLRSIASESRGLVLVTGIAGSGKSTTIATMLEHINQHLEKHIVTVEDPIEYIFNDKVSIFDQREIGMDSKDFPTALKHVVRQSPDVIMIGEMRDVETVESAFHAAETGHLVFSTLHTVNAMQTVDRIINFFPPHQHEFLRQQMSLLIKAIVSIRLIPTVDGKNRVPAVELMVSTPTIREYLYEGKIRELYKAIKEGAYFGNQTFNQALKLLIEQNLISLDDALNAADSPDELKLEIRGITKGSRTDFNFNQ
jgi:twitching motility protein PilT